jgi:hypothetical protein
MHALHLPPRHLLRASLTALLLAFAFALMAAGLNGADLSVSSGSASTPSDEIAMPPGPPIWATSPMTPPTAELAR